MKNSSKLLALGLVLFLGACSAAEGDFLKKVEGKTAYADAAYTIKFGVFNGDGRKFTMDGAPVATFSKAIDENTAEYTLSGQPITFTTTDGKTGTADSAGKTPIWLKK